MRAKTIPVLILLAAVVLVGASCTPKTEPGAQAPTTQETQPTDAKPTLTSSAPSESTATPQPVSPTEEEPAEKELQVSELSSLDRFDSYRLRHVMSWEQLDGESGSSEIVTEFVRDPMAQRMVLSGTADDDSWTMETIQIGDTQYINTGEEWMAIQSADQEIDEAGETWGPDDFLWDSQGKYLGKETVSGMQTKHFRYETGDFGLALGLSRIKEAEADVWVSTEYNVQVKVIMRIVGVDDKDVEGTFSMESYVTDINQPIVIEAPQGVEKPGLPEDVPLLDDATEITSMDTITSFRSASPQAQIVEFYKTQMAAKGWQMEESLVETMMSFTKADRAATILIAEEDGSTSVTIMLQ